MLFSWCLGHWPHFKSLFCLIQNDLKNLCEQKKMRLGGDGLKTLHWNV